MEDRSICESDITTCFMFGLRIGSSSTHCFANVAICPQKFIYNEINHLVTTFFQLLIKHLFLSLPWTNSHAGINPSCWDQQTPSNSTCSSNLVSSLALPTSAIVKEANKGFGKWMLHQRSVMVQCVLTPRTYNRCQWTSFWILSSHRLRSYNSFSSGYNFEKNNTKGVNITFRGGKTVA